jgi:gliding motility-associated-like protein
MKNENGSFETLKNLNVLKLPYHFPNLKCMKNKRSILIILSFAFAYTKALAAPPSWSVSAPSFQYNMTVIAKINENCVDLNNPNNKIGAFLGANCRGVNFTNVNVGSSNLAYLVIFSNATSGETITLRYYNSVTDQVQNVTATIAFVNNATIGSSALPYTTLNNYAPTALQLSVTSVSELTTIGTKFGKFTSSDQDLSNTHIYTLVLGAGSTNNSMFSISGDSLEVNSVLNFNTLSTATIRIRSTDNGGCFIEQIITINVINVNNTPSDILLSNASFFEGLPVNTIVGAFSTVDVDLTDMHTYSFVSGTGSTDNAAFAITGANLTTAIVGFFATQSTYSIRVRSTDLGLANFEKILLISVLDGANAPINILLSNVNIYENRPISTFIGTLSSIDPDLGNTFSYNLVAGFGSNNLFSVSNDSLYSAASFDFETISNHTIKVKSTDNTSLMFEKILAISILDTTDAPTNIVLSNNLVGEVSSIGFGIGQLSTNDIDLPSDQHVYSLVAGIGATDNLKVTIDLDTIRLNAVLNYNLQDTLFVRIRSTDLSGFFTEKAFILKVTDLNETPSNILNSVNSFYENQLIGTTVSAFSTSDTDVWDAHSYTLVSGVGSTNNAAFSITGAQLVTAQNFNFEQQASYSIRVRTTDFYGLYFEKVFLLTLKDTSDSPTNILLSSSSISENRSILSFVSKLNSTDEDVSETFVYSFENVGINNNSSFVINNDSLFALEIFDFESINSYLIKLKTMDSEGKSFVKNVTILILDSLDNSTDISLSKTTLTEKNPILSAIGTFSTIDNNGNTAHNYTLVAGSGSEDNSNFTILDDVLKIEIIADFEQKKEYKIRVRSALTNGSYIEKPFIISVLDSAEIALVLPVNNFVSANGDGENDVFFIQNIEIYKDAELSIFNDNGVSVFTTNSYDNTWSGKDLPLGLYYFTLLGPGLKYNGSILLSK